MEHETTRRDEILVAVLGFLSVPLIILAIAADWLWDPVVYGH